MSRFRKILLIILFVITIIALGFALYWVFFKPRAVEVPTPPIQPTFPGGLPTGPTGVIPPTEVTPPGVLPPSAGVVIPPTGVTRPLGTTLSDTANGGVVISQRVSSAEADYVAVAGNGRGLNYYDRVTGLFNRVTPDGRSELLSTRSFPEIKNVAWSPADDKAVIEFPDGSNIVYNFANNESFTLPSQFEDFSFSPQGTQIAAKDMKINEEDRWLVIVDDKGKNKKLVEHLGLNANRVQVKWSPNDLIVGTSAKSIDGNRAEVILLTKDGSKVNTLTVQGRDLKYDYSPSGNRMAYSVYNSNSNYLPTLWITTTNPNAIEANRINTGLNTWADKCSFANESTMYCAVPKSIEPYSGILRSLNTSDDQIYKIDTNTGQATLAADPLTPTTVQSLKVSKDGSTLFYVDQSDNSINTINLP